MKTQIIFLTVIIMMAISFLPEVLQAQENGYGTGNQQQQTTQKSDEKADGGSGGGAYTLSNVPLGFLASLRRGWGMECGVFVSNGTAKNSFGVVLDYYQPWVSRKDQSAGIRLVYSPLKWVEVSLSEAVFFRKKSTVGQDVPTGDLLGEGGGTRICSYVGVDFSLGYPLKGDGPYIHKVSLHLVPFGVSHLKLGKNYYGQPLQYYDFGVSYTYRIPVGTGKTKK